MPVAIASFLMHDPDTGAPFGLATVQRDMTERVAAERSVRRLSEHRQALLERLVEAQETERAKIAGDVHDDPVQALAVVDLRLGLLRRRIAEQAPELLDAVGAVQETVVAATERLRALLFDLEAPDLDARPGAGPGAGGRGALPRHRRPVSRWPPTTSRPPTAACAPSPSGSPARRWSTPASTPGRSTCG